MGAESDVYPAVWGRLTAKAKARLVLDAVGIVALCAQFVKYPQVAFWHEVVGLVAVAFLAAHLWLDRSLLKGLVQKVTRGGGGGCAIALIMVDALLFVCFCIIVVTGVATSAHFPLLISPEPRALWVYAHLFAPVVMMACLGVHLGLHGEYLAVAIKRLLPWKVCMSATVARVALAFVLAGGAFAFATGEFALLAGVSKKIVYYVSHEGAFESNAVENPQANMTIDPAKSAPRSGSSAPVAPLPQALVSMGLQLGRNFLVVGLFASITLVVSRRGPIRRRP